LPLEKKEISLHFVEPAGGIDPIVCMFLVYSQAIFDKNKNESTV